MSFRNFALTVAAASVIASAGDVNDRIKDSATLLREVMGAPDQEIPEWVLQRAHCAVIVPGLKSGGFIVGAKYGKGIMTCRSAAGGWSAPSAVRVEGGSVGFQIGVSDTDAVLMVMNEQGKKKLLESEFTMGGSAAAVAGPVGRSAKAETDALMHAQILSYSRSRGVFAGVALEGGTMRADDSENKNLYGRDIDRREILNGKVTMPVEAKELISLLNRYSVHEKQSNSQN